MRKTEGKSLDMFRSLSQDESFASGLAALSSAQLAGAVISVVAGAGIWLIVAGIAPPEDVGILGRIVSTSTLLAGILTAGLGQFLLSVIRRTDVERVRSYLWKALFLGGTGSALLGLLLGVIQDGNLSETTILMGLFCAGISLSNLQDALYLSTGLPFDVPAKGAAIVIARLLLLSGLLAAQVKAIHLLEVFVASQLLISVGWLLFRGPKGLQQHKNIYAQTEILPTNNRSVFVISYLYSIAITSITMGVPAIITTLVRSSISGKFYLSWTVASLLSTLSVSVANSILALSSGRELSLKRYKSILVYFIVPLLAFGFLAVVFFPPILTAINRQYDRLSDLIFILVLGQILFGAAIVSLAVFRTSGEKRRVIAFLFAWPSMIVSAVFVGTILFSTAGGAIGFFIGNAVSLVPIGYLTSKSLRASHNIPQFQSIENDIESFG